MGNRPIRSQFLLVFLSFLALLIGFIFIVNAFFLKPFYQWTKTQQLKSVSMKFDKVAVDPGDADFQSLLEKALYEDQAIIDIFTADGMLQYSTRNPKEFHEFNLSPLADTDTWNKLQNGRIAVEEKMDPRRGLDFLTVYHVLPGGEILSLSSPMAAIQQSAAVLNEFLLIILVLFLILAWIVATRFASYFSKPIVALQQMTHRMIQFDFSSRWEETRRDELGDLGKNMNRLMTIIGQFIEELRGKNELLLSELEQKTVIERQRKQFVSNVSHELKTPIALIQGYAEGLRQNIHENPEDRDEYAEVIIDEAKKMNLLVRELLVLSQLESPHTNLNIEVFDLCESIETAVSRLGSLHAERGISFGLRFQEGSHEVAADAAKINQVINNYLANALFFVSGRKTIIVSTQRVEPILRTTVYNTGPLIPEDEMELIWTSFYKVDKARTPGEGGTGLGLSIVKRIMDLHKMDYGVANAADGVEFWFDLPLSPNGKDTDDK